MDSPVASRLRKRAPAEAKELPKEKKGKAEAGKKEKEKIEKKKPTKATSGKASPADAWREIATILDPTGGAAEEVILALEHPDEYDERFSSRLESRGLDTIADGTVHALIDALQARKKCFIADRHTSFPEFVNYLLLVSPEAVRTHKAIARMKKELAGALKNEHDRYDVDDEPLTGLLVFVEETGHTPLCITNYSDQLQYVVTDAEAAKRVVQLAKQAKCEINPGIY